MVDFFTYFIENEKKNIRAQVAESVEKACSSMDKCLQNLIATSEDWVRGRKRKKRIRFVIIKIMLKFKMELSG
jgi:hypothetical protein